MGDGTTVASQSPSTGTSVTKGGKVILYTEVGGNSGDTIEVPNLVGMTAAEVNETMTYYDLNYAIVGSSASEYSTSRRRPERSCPVELPLP